MIRPLTLSRGASLLGAAFFVLMVRPVHAAPSDIVPRGDVAYDLLGSLSAHGLVPGYTLADFARGDRLFTRADMARLVAAIRAAHPEIGSQRGLSLSILEREFTPELRNRGIVPSHTSGQKGLVALSDKQRLLSNPTSGSNTVRAVGALPVGRDGYATVSAGTYRDEWYPNGLRNYPAIETAYLRVDGRALDVTIGMRPLRWGAGYYGPLMPVGDAARAFPMIQVEKGFKLPGTLGRRAGRLYFTEFAGEFFQPSVPNAAPDATGSRRYLLGRRIETAGGGRWTLSFNDALQTTRLPDPALALVLPFYTYYHDEIKNGRNRALGFLFSGGYPDSAWSNYIFSVQTSYRADGRGSLLYGEVLVDDVQAPQGLGVGTKTPRKLGRQIGGYMPDVGGVGRYSARVEFTTLDALTYTKLDSPPVAWTERGLPLGFPTGPNATVLFGRFEARLTPRIQAAVEGSALRRTDNHAPGVRADTVGLYTSYAVRNDAFVGLRLGRQRSQALGQATETHTRAEVNIGAGF